jgi:hypothetical protein
MGLSLAVNEIHKMASTYGTQVPQIGTTPGTISVYRHGPRDILMSEELLNRGSESQVRKVAAHEYYHYMQHNYAMRNMKNKPVTELEAEANALRWINGEQPQLPLVPHPGQDYQQIRSLRNLTFNFNPSFSSCGFDSTEASTGDYSLLEVIRNITGRQ